MGCIHLSLPGRRELRDFYGQRHNELGQIRVHRLAERGAYGAKGIRGVWYPRKLDSGVKVLSFALPLNRLSTATRGTIVVNLKESQIEQYLQSSKSGKQGYLLMKSSGTIISHHDKDLLLKNAYEEPYIREIARQALPEGYMFRELNGERLLYAWSPTKEFGWTNVSIYSVDELMNKPLTLQRSILLLTIVIILRGPY